MKMLRSESRAYMQLENKMKSFQENVPYTLEKSKSKGCFLFIQLSSNPMHEHGK